jgi:hypothetical protein
VLWDTFIELHNKRSSGMAPQPIGWRDLQAWQDVRQVALTPWEIDTLMALDTAAMESIREAKK